MNSILITGSVFARFLFIQGQRSNFEIGGRGPLVTQYWGWGQGSTSVFCYYYLWCSKFPARLQSLNSVTKPDQIHEVELSSF